MRPAERIDQLFKCMSVQKNKGEREIFSLKEEKCKTL